MPRNRLPNPSFYFPAPGVTLPLTGPSNGVSYPIIQYYNYQQDSNGGTPPNVSVNLLTFPLSFPLSTIPGEPEQYVEFNLTDQGTGIGANAYQKFGIQSLDIKTLNGQQAVFSFWANSSVANREIVVQVRRNYGTGGTGITPDDVFLQTMYPINSGWQRYGFKFPILSLQNTVTPIVFGTNNDGYLACEIFFSGPASLFPKIANGVLPNIPCIIDIAQVQLEQGGQPHDFEFSYDPKTSGSGGNVAYLPLAGGTMTGGITTPSIPVSSGYNNSSQVLANDSNGYLDPNDSAGTGGALYLQRGATGTAPMLLQLYAGGVGGGHAQICLFSSNTDYSFINLVSSNNHGWSISHNKTVDNLGYPNDALMFGYSSITGQNLISPSSGMYLDISGNLTAIGYLKGTYLTGTAGGTVTPGTAAVNTGNVAGTLLTTTGNGSGLTSLNGAAITAATIPTSAINATGTPSSTTFYRGDGTWSTPSGSGTVTTVSVVSANGLAGTVSNATSTPAITLTTSITGVLKGNGTAISAAVGGTDFCPATTGTSSQLLGSNGSGGLSNVTVGSGLTYSAGTLSSSSTGGTVTTFSAGTLSPLFTTSVANATSTPALTFSLTNAAGASWFGNATGSSAAPSFNTSVLPASLIPALTGDVTSTSGTVATTVGKINGTSLAGLATGILKNTTSTGVPSIAVAGTDYLTPTGNGSGLTSLNGANVTNGTLSIAALSTSGASAGNVPTYNGASWALTTPSSSGSGFTNWITNGTAESGTSGWATYNDGASATPVHGTGGVVTNLSLSQTTSNPLSGTASFQVVKSASNIQGEGISYDFTTDNANLARIQQISMQLQVLSGSISSGDLTLWIYDKTNGVLIQPTSYLFPSAVVGSSPLIYNIAATFQTNITSTSYRLIFHFASTSSSALTFIYDSVMVGPQLISYGSPESDWITYSPTLQGITLSSQEIKWRRVGDSCEIAFQAIISATSASQLQIGLPSGLTIDSGKFANTHLVALGANVGNSPAIPIIATGGNTYLQASGGLTSYATPVNGSSAVLAGAFSFEATVPILGWSSAVRMSNPDATRTVNFEVNGTVTATITSTFSAVTYGTVVKDTHAQYSSGIWTCPVQGTYDFSAGLDVSGTLASNGYLDIAIYKNGSIQKAARTPFFGTDSSAIAASIAASFDCNTGDTIQVFVKSSGTVTVNSTTGYNYFSGFRVAGPERIAASEKVLADYVNTSGNTVGTSLGAVIGWTKITDTHGAFSGSTFTSPRAGLLRIECSMAVSLVTQMAAELQNINSTGTRNIIFSNVLGSGGVGSVSLAKTISVNAGDTVQVFASSSTSSALNTSAGYNQVSFTME